MPPRPRFAQRFFFVVRSSLAFGASVFFHLAAMTPLVVMWWLDSRDSPPPHDPGGEEGTEAGPAGDDGAEVPLGSDAPVTVTMIDEAATPEQVAEVNAEAIAPAPEPAAAPARPEQHPTPTKRASEALAARDGSPEGSEGAVATTAPPGVEGKKPRGNKKPCEALEEIQQIGPNEYRIERGVVDWYARHPKELGQEVGVQAHPGPNGKPDGARLYLPRCSVLRQLGIRHADIVHKVNGKTVTTLPGAIALYFNVRNDQVVTVELARKNGEPQLLRYTLVR